MKKIKNTQELQIQKMQLRILQLEQEKRLNNNWKNLMDNFNQDILIGQKTPETKDKGTLKDFLITTGLGLGAGFLSGKLTEIAVNKIDSAVQIGVGKLAKKIKLGMQKKN